MMSKKKFFEIADKAMLCVNNFEDVLGLIECDTWSKARSYAEQGDEEYANILKVRARRIHSELAKVGYYDK